MPNADLATADDVGYLPAGRTARRTAPVGGGRQPVGAHRGRIEVPAEPVDAARPRPTPHPQHAPPPGGWPYLRVPGHAGPGAAHRPIRRSRPSRARTFAGKLRTHRLTNALARRKRQRQAVRCSDRAAHARGLAPPSPVRARTCGPTPAEPRGALAQGLVRRTITDAAQGGGRSRGLGPGI
jgi:hypothetical protein